MIFQFPISVTKEMAKLSSHILPYQDFEYLLVTNCKYADLLAQIRQEEVVIITAKRIQTQDDQKDPTNITKTAT